MRGRQSPEWFAGKVGDLAEQYLAAREEKHLSLGPVPLSTLPSAGERRDAHSPSTHPVGSAPSAYDFEQRKRLHRSSSNSLSGSRRSLDEASFVRQAQQLSSSTTHEAPRAVADIPNAGSISYIQPDDNTADLDQSPWTRWIAHRRRTISNDLTDSSTSRLTSSLSLHQAGRSPRHSQPDVSGDWGLSGLLERLSRRAATVCPGGQNSADDGKTTVMVVDGNPMSTAILRRGLTEEGFSIVSRATVEQVLPSLPAFPVSPLLRPPYRQ